MRKTLDGKLKNCILLISFIHKPLLRMLWTSLCLLLLSTCLLLLNGCASPHHCQELQLGRIYFQEGEFKRSFHQLLPLAVMGYPEAQYAVGYMYYYGFGACQDEESGLFWMNKAAEQGEIHARRALTMLNSCPQTICEQFPGTCCRPRGIQQPQHLYAPPHCFPNGMMPPPDINAAAPPYRVPCDDESCLTGETILGPHPTVSGSRVEDEVMKCIPARPLPEEHCLPPPPPIIHRQSVRPSIRYFSPRPIHRLRRSFIPAPERPSCEPECRGKQAQEAISTTTPLQDKLQLASTTPKSYNDDTHSTPNDYYVIQLGGGYTLDTVKAIQCNLHLIHKSHIYKTNRDGKDWYVLAYGKYSDMPEGREAKNNLPMQLSDQHPWVRSANDLVLIG